MSHPIDTLFAPAERCDPETIARQRELFRAQAFFCDMAERLPSAILVLNLQRQTVFTNSAALELFGLKSVDDAIDRRPGELIRCIHATESPGGCGTTAFCRYCGSVGSILKSHEGVPAVDECRLIVEREKGQEALNLRVWSNPMELAGERFTLFVMADIGDEKRRATLERIFLHDVLNTATALQGFTQILSSGIPTEAQREMVTQRVRALSGRLVDEIQTHRLLLEAERGELQLEWIDHSVPELLQSIVEVYQRPDVLDQRNLGLAPNLPQKTLRTDRTLLGRVLGNMIKNALEASLPGDTVTVGARDNGEGITFWVHNPTVMPERVRLQVFNRSFSTKGAGRGLGTYSMKFLTEHYLQGRVDFTSTEPEGTTFRVWLPCTPPTDGEG